jgi:hypothetical protein
VINRSPAAIFEYITNPDNVPVYIPQIIRGELATPPPLSLGSEFLAESMVGGKLFAVTEKVVEFTPPNVFSTSIKSGRRPNHGGYRLTPVESGGTVTEYTFWMVAVRVRSGRWDAEPPHKSANGDQAAPWKAW